MVFIPGINVTPPQSFVATMLGMNGTEPQWNVPGYPTAFISQAGTGTETLGGHITIAQGDVVSITGLDAALAAGYVTGFTVTDVDSSAAVSPTSTNPLTYPCPGVSGLRYDSTFHVAAIGSTVSLAFAASTPVPAAFWTDFSGAAFEM